MAKIALASLERLKGKIGNISYYVHNGQQMGRKRESNMPQTMNEFQMEQQLKFGELVRLSRAMVPALRLGFVDLKKDWTPGNMFMHRNKDIVTVTDLESREVAVDFARLRCAEGIVVPPTVAVTREEWGNNLMFSVTPDGEFGTYCEADDKVYAVVVSDGEIFRCKVMEIGTRGGGESVTLTIPAYMDGELHVYAFARAAKGKMASTSMYLPLE